MASYSGGHLLQCSVCFESLNLESKTLPCLHSLCRSCLKGNFEGATDGIVQCPECHEPFRVDLLRLSSIVVNTLRRQQLDSSEWKCNLCSDGIKSNATNWCKDCQQLHCTHCSRIHNTILKRYTHEHNILELEGMERSEMIKIIMRDMCSTHQKAKDSYCERCNVCLCDTCYKDHSFDSPGCSSQPSSVREEALKQKSQIPTLAKEMDDIEIRLRGQNERTKKLTDELTSECHDKCRQLWVDFDQMKRKTEELCDDMIRITNEQVEKWRHLLEENENILKQLQIWRQNLHHLLSGIQIDEDVVCGVRLLGSKLSSRLQKTFVLEEKSHLGVTFPKWWLETLEQLKSEKIGLASLTDKMPAQNVDLVKELNLCGLSLRISSMHVNKEDDHIFISDFGWRNPAERNPSIMEFTETGDFVCNCELIEGRNRFSPESFCSISSDSFMVVCGMKMKLFILKRRRNPPRLEIEKVFPTKKEFYFVSQINDSIFASDLFQVYSITKEGEIIETIKTENGSSSIQQIRADPSNGNIWGRRWVLEGSSYSDEIFSFDSKGKEIQSVKIKEEFRDFHVNGFGHLYFCDKKGIFSFPMNKMIYKFKNESELYPRIFLSKDKMFVSLKINGKYLINIFEMLY